MPQELKWLLILVFFVISIFAIGIGVGSYTTHSCKMEAIKANRPVDEINRLCR